MSLPCLNKVQFSKVQFSLHIEFAKLRCWKETCIDVKNSTILLISNQVFQKNAELSFIMIVVILKNLMRNMENYMQNACFLRMSFILDNIIINTCTFGKFLVSETNR